MSEIVVDVWLYGNLAQYAGELNRGSFANLPVHLPEGSTLASLLAHLDMPSEARGITFINGELSAMPGVQPDLNHVLRDQDRVAFFHLQSMWPFQYRFGVPTVSEMSEKILHGDESLHHAYTDSDIPEAE